MVLFQKIKLLTKFELAKVAIRTDLDAAAVSSVVANTWYVVWNGAASVPPSCYNSPLAGKTVYVDYSTKHRHELQQFRSIGSNNDNSNNKTNRTENKVQNLINGDGGAVL